MTMTFYTIKDFDKFVFSENEYKLPSDIIESFRYLENEIRIHTTLSEKNFSSAKKFTNKSNDKKRQSNGQKKPVDETWDRPVFKVTVMETKEGVEKQISDIRVLLNKISSKNYEIQRDNIMQNITIIMETSETQEDVIKIVSNIFDIASTNKFYSEIYAELYKELVDKFPIFSEVMDPFIANFMETIHEINYVDSNIDYDGYCNYNKINDKRKSISAFITNLMIKETLSQSILIDIIAKFQEIALAYADEENRTNEVDEITENLFIILTMSFSHLKTHELWESKIYKNILTFSKFKTKEKKSVSSRVIFKYMDLIDKLK
jgi:hypothetical protein